MDEHTAATEAATAAKQQRFATDRAPSAAHWTKFTCAAERTGKQLHARAKRLLDEARATVEHLDEVPARPILVKAASKVTWGH